MHRDARTHSSTTLPTYRTACIQQKNARAYIRAYIAAYRWDWAIAAWTCSLGRGRASPRSSPNIRIARSSLSDGPNSASQRLRHKNEAPNKVQRTQRRFCVGVKHAYLLYDFVSVPRASQRMGTVLRSRVEAPLLCPTSSTKSRTRVP
jgi:hypothetical protein